MTPSPRKPSSPLTAARKPITQHRSPPPPSVQGWFNENWAFIMKAVLNVLAVAVLVNEFFLQPDADPIAMLAAGSLLGIQFTFRPNGEI